MRSKRSLVSLAAVLALGVAPGCNKLEELTGGEKAENKPEEAKADGGGEAKADGGGEAKADGGDAPTEPVVEAVVEPIPVEALHTGLDLMLSLVPDGAEFMIARDATVVAEYVEEGTRFLDGPMGTLETGPFAGERELQDMKEAFAEAKAKTDVIKAALEGSGIQLKEGAAIVQTPANNAYIIFNAADPNALVAVGKATGERELSDLKCKAIEAVPGFNVCSDSQAEVDAYAPSTDPAPTRASLAAALPGVNLDDANVVAHIEKGEPDEVYFAVSTIPGQLYMAVSTPKNPDLAELRTGMTPGEAKTLAQVQPGAGFIWGRVSPELMTKSMGPAGSNPMAASVTKSMTGEFVLAGSVDPGGLIFQAGTTDTAALEGALTLGVDMGKAQVPKSIPELPGSSVTFELVPVEGGGKTAQAMHLGLTGLSELDVLKGYTGLHADAWAFAANDVFTLAVGPDKDHVGKLLDVSAGGPSAATLDSLPPQLAEGLGKGEVGFIMHMPMDFLHGAQMHSLVRSALKDVPTAPPDQLLALAGLAAPLSSATMWIAKSGAEPVIHISVQAIGNRATDEGRAALDAAHTVADGGDPAVAFASLATAYAASPMAWAYKTRAGTEGPGYMVGSGVGAVMAVAAVAVPLTMGASNKALAEDLGVKPEDPEPELKPTTAPKRPVTTPVEPKADPVEPKPTEDPQEDPKSPIVEPTRPLPPKPTEDPKPTVRVPKRLGQGKHKGE
ncbi:hypothetical protein [Paraliomyxa miuraensis]|uniref:hypothetical protein n=1 Tax=Paraliomyxa miuraensis TaxID=376150 RepID=UPI0022522275|nr:hypothetical protein [Paraliomyxa miuraensis]MCX4242857.1 hypothetical protein [Paraliomyxa miuraensis]